MDGWMYRCIAVSLYRCIAVSLYRCIAVSLYRPCPSQGAVFMDIFNYAYGCSLDDLHDSLMTLQADDSKILQFVRAPHLRLGSSGLDILCGNLLLEVPFNQSTDF